MFPYTFAPPHSQKKEITPTALGGSFKRSTLRVDANANTTLAESTKKRTSDVDFSFSQSLSSRHAEPYTHSISPFRHRIKIEDGDPLVSDTGMPSRLRSAEKDIFPRSRALQPSNSCSRDDAETIVKMEELDTKMSSSSGLELFSDALGKMKSLEDEVSQQRNYINDLESRVAAKSEENTILSRDLLRMETANKQEMNRYREALGRVMKNYSALKSELDDLKTSSQSFSLIVSEAKANMDSFVTLRDSAHSRLRDIEAMYDDEGRFMPTSEAKDTVDELRSELLKTQQVADMFRDKLHAMGTELAEAQARILELEESVKADRFRSESTALNIRQTADKMMELARCLQEQKHESIQAAAKAYEMEQQLVHTQIKLQEAQSVIASMREETAAREELLQDQGTKLLALRSAIDFQEGNVKALEARARKAEEELVQALNYNHKLQGRFDAATSLEKNLTQQASQLLSERNESKEKLHSTECRLAEVQNRETSLSSDLEKMSMERDTLVDKLRIFDDVKREVDAYREKYAGSQVSLKVLQERFDDQCVALAAAKESIGDIQDRLHATECKAMETSIEHRAEMTRLQDQNALLKAENEDKYASFQAIQNELSRKEGTFEALLETERSGKNEAARQTQEAKTKVESVLADLAQADFRMQEMAKRLSAAEVPSTEHEQEVEALKVRIAELEATQKKLVDQAATISHRYENNELNDDEKALVALLMRKARAVHDREMIEKNNEIKRRDSLIKENMARITQLESYLARWVDHESLVRSTGEQSISTAIDATKPQEPSPDHQPNIRGTGCEVPSTTVTHGVTDGASEVLPVLGPSSRSTGYSAFAKLCREDTDDIADIADDNPPVATGKRVTFAHEEDESLRPMRRAKHGRGTGIDKVVDQTLAAGPASSTTSGTKKKAAPRRR